MPHLLTTLVDAFEQGNALLLPPRRRAGVSYRVEQDEQGRPSISFFYRGGHQRFDLTARGQVYTPEHGLLSASALATLLGERYGRNGGYLVFLGLLLSGLFCLDLS
jgi:hypothetical protein